jgi:hypothetical protein
MFREGYGPACAESVRQPPEARPRQVTAVSLAGWMTAEADPAPVRPEASAHHVRAANDGHILLDRA